MNIVFFLKFPVVIVGNILMLIVMYESKVVRGKKECHISYYWAHDGSVYLLYYKILKFFTFYKFKYCFR